MVYCASVGDRRAIPAGRERDARRSFLSPRWGAV